MITIIAQPAKFTPSGNKVVFQFESDQPNILYFRLELKEATSNGVIKNFNLNLTPETPSGTYVDLSRILDNLTPWRVDNSINIMSLPIDRSILAYKVKVTEVGIVDGLYTDLSTLELPETYYTWNAELERSLFRNYNMTNYLISTGLPTKFLTKKPNGSKVNENSSEQLYFMHLNEDYLVAVFKTYNKYGTLLNQYTHTITQLDQSHMFRLQVSPKAMKEVLVADFNDVHYYTVHLEDENNIVKSEQRKYFYEKLPCYLEPINLLWVNSLGGVDSMTFVNLQETINYSRTTIKRNPFDVYNGVYTDNNGDILNATEDVLNVNQSGNYVAYSRTVTDEESYWMAELFKSKNVFVELDDEALVPVMVNNSQYQIQRQKYNRMTPTTVQVNFTMSDDIIPREAIAYGSTFTGKTQIEFINAQLNGDILYDTVLTFINTNALGTENGKEGVGGAVATTDPVMKFEFNKLQNLIGLTQNMSINLNGTLVMVIDFFADYLNKPFRFTSKDGVEHIGTFKNGTVNF